ncbi:hypothetical protein D6833_09910 [Candidatus Parcubacteria bacterium]|nr:MAG: hypothetical protein D6833_09910 [Candidatus Parcubacteria bacterium]
MPTNQRLHKSICVPFSEEDYSTLLGEPEAFRRYLNQVYAHHPELFPEAMRDGFVFHSFVWSRKQQLSLRRIQLRNGQVYQIRPSFVMPYMVGKTDDVEKALYLRRFGVPFEALAYVFGRDAMYWYRLTVSLGRNSLVGTTLKSADALPAHLVADEKHTRRQGKPAYIATTAAEGCFLGAEVSEAADTESLTQAYGVFQQEAQAIHEDYMPETVTTDGWEPTQKAFKALFPKVTLLLCFLHAFLKLRDRAKRLKQDWFTLADKLWNTYDAPTRACFSQRLRRLNEWVQHHISLESVRHTMTKIARHVTRYSLAYRFPDAPRTTNPVDRLMNYQDRCLEDGQLFHGTRDSANLAARAMALLWNFHPYGTRTRNGQAHRGSPFEDINGFRYHDSWLQNFMIAASRAGNPP